MLPRPPIPCLLKYALSFQKRQRRSFTPTSDDGGPPITHNEDIETPTPENAPLIRQAVGFSSVGANVTTYQATVAPQPVVPYFLPGQAPPPPPKPKVTKPRAPRKKKGEQYSSQTSRFKISGSISSPNSGSASLATTSPGNSASTVISSGTTAVSGSMTPAASYASYVDGSATGGPNNISDGTFSVAPDAPSLGTKRPRKSSKRKAPTSHTDYLSQPSVQPPIRPLVLPPIGASVTPQSQCPRNFNPGGQPPVRQRTCSDVGPGSALARLQSPCTYHWV